LFGRKVNHEDILDSHFDGDISGCG
jgi:hypothetical protein